MADQNPDDQIDHTDVRDEPMDGVEAHRGRAAAEIDQIARDAKEALADQGIDIDLFFLSPNSGKAILIYGTAVPRQTSDLHASGRTRNSQPPPSRRRQPPRLMVRNSSMWSAPSSRLSFCCHDGEDGCATPARISVKRDVPCCSKNARTCRIAA